MTRPLVQRGLLAIATLAGRRIEGRRHHARPEAPQRFTLAPAGAE